MLQKVIDLWMATDFRLVPHVSGVVSIIAGADDILAQLEESQVTIGTIRGSRYVTPIKVSPHFNVNPFDGIFRNFCIKYYQKISAQQSV